MIVSVRDVAVAEAFRYACAASQGAAAAGRDVHPAGEHGEGRTAVDDAAGESDS